MAGVGQVNVPHVGRVPERKVTFGCGLKVRTAYGTLVTQNGPEPAVVFLFFFLVVQFCSMRICAVNNHFDQAVGQNQWYHFGAGAPPILVNFSGDWDVHWG